MSGVRPTLVVSAAVVAVALFVSGCGGRGAGSRGGVAARDSSFAGVSYQRGRSPMDLSVARGKIVYGRYCAICHGESGEGDGFNAYNVKATYGLTPTSFADSSTFASVRADSALEAIRNGGPAVGKSPAMPPWGRTLTRGDLIDVWDYVHSLAHAARGN